MTGNRPATTHTNDDEPSTRILLRNEDGSLKLPGSVPLERTTMTQSFRVRRGEARRVREQRVRLENQARPSALLDASFPAGVALLLSLQPVLDALDRGSIVAAIAWLVVPAALVLAVMAPLSRRLDVVRE